MMKGRDILIRIRLPEGQAAMFEGQNAMVVPLSDAEVVELRDKMILSHEGMTKLAGALSTLSTVLETKGSAEPEIRKLIGLWLEPSRLIAANLERMRELLGRATFVGGENKGKEKPE